MRISLNWLREYVDIDLPPEVLAELLTMSGLEVEALEPAGHGLDQILVSRIVELRKHPQADRLTLCRVDTGRDQRQIVCGASNLEVGALVPLALPGTALPGGTVISEGDFRGELSGGMLLAEDEMGLSEDHSGIMILPPDLSPGTSLGTALPLADWVLEVGITPNRPDCNAVIGIAREVAALTGARLRQPEIGIEELGRPVDELTRVEIKDTVGCPRYAAGVIEEVRLGPSPFWLRRRLHLAGMRSINNLVDVTNYVMLEMGQPLHAFDYDRLRENRIVVRRARQDEPFTTLDGKTHRLNAETLLICDAERAVALAGIMGGLNSEIFEGTRRVLLESAFFDPMTIRRGAKRLGISTEASYRFERCIDLDGVTRALRRAMGLMARLAAGRVARGAVDNYPRRRKPVDIEMRVGKTNRFLGTGIPGKTMVQYLRSLEIGVEEAGDDVLRVRPPSFRPDITREVDLMEEVARLSGYQNIPVTSPRIRPSEEEETAEMRTTTRVRCLMKDFGFSEVISYSFIPPDFLAWLGPEPPGDLRAVVELLNPLTREQSVLRTSLVPGILAAVRTNLQHEEKSLRVFEVGKTFFRQAGEQLPLEKNCLAAVLTGLYRQKAWYQEESAADFFDIKGAVEALARALGLGELVFEAGTDFPWYDRAESASIRAGGELLGQAGRVNAELAAALDLKADKLYLLELDLQALTRQLPTGKTFRPLPRYPAVYRDLSLVMDRETESGRIADLIRREGGEWVERVSVFDVYEGRGVDSGKKAVAYKVCFRSPQGTLDGGQVSELHERIVSCISRETGARLREG